MKEPLKIPHLAGREKPLLELGFSSTDATWLTLVCFHSGVFTRRQYAELHQCHRMAAHRLVRRLIDAGLARERLIPDTSLKATHVHGRALYRALNIRHVRHRRAARPLVFLRRLLCLDHVAGHLSLPWLPTEVDKLEYFLCRGFPPSDLPQRTYAGALNDTRRYFHHQLPIASDDHTATFLYADPGRDTDTELRSWAESHLRLWTRLYDAGTNVHVAVVTRTIEAKDDYGRTLGAWLSPPSSHDALTPDERSTLTLIEDAIVAGAHARLRPWGGFAAARQTALRLRERAGATRRGDSASRPRIHSFSTHHAHRLSPDSLMR